MEEREKELQLEEERRLAGIEENKSSEKKRKVQSEQDTNRESGKNKRVKTEMDTVKEMIKQLTKTDKKAIKYLKRQAELQKSGQSQQNQQQTKKKESGGGGGSKNKSGMFFDKVVLPVPNNKLPIGYNLDLARGIVQPSCFESKSLPDKISLRNRIRAISLEYGLVVNNTSYGGGGHGLNNGVLTGSGGGGGMGGSSSHNQFADQEEIVELVLYALECHLKNIITNMVYKVRLLGNEDDESGENDENVNKDVGIPVNRQYVKRGASNLSQEQKSVYHQKLLEGSIGNINVKNEADSTDTNSDSVVGAGVGAGVGIGIGIGTEAGVGDAGNKSNSKISGGNVIERLYNSIAICDC
ncbi:hypothetical protein AX774_g6152 [Zancudomyces culisetae]|uniref:Uncharacterized protein n=1 Tax=Zancudomyces culisetae TaxID=1213189 RepID=A0A1R1PHS5_ZANCU|nr:hypothetical protein AX774_g6152 [Zancudomyces culisetae]|eukprot:OMH80412.1 hypothetical protein AX774_g6152 [Zancudomyces culisetae]